MQNMVVRLILNLALHLIGFGVIVIMLGAALTSQNPTGTRIWAVGVVFGVLLILPATRGILLTKYGIAISTILAILMFIVIYFGLLTLTPGSIIIQ